MQWRQPLWGLLDPERDKALVVDGGSFGHRFRQLLDLHGIANVAIELEPGSPLTPEHLEAAEGEFTALLINLGGTSQGVFAMPI